MPVFPIDEAQLVALFMQSVTYGVHVVTFTICMWKLVKKFRSGQGSAHWPWTVIAIALFANGTVDVSFNLYHNLIAFIFYRGNGGAEEEFTASTTWLNLIRSVSFSLGIVISDAALMYRAWIICNRRWIVIVPSIVLLCATLASATAYLYYMNLENMETVMDEKKTMIPIIIVIYTTTITNNVVCTGMIMHRIWQVTKQITEFLPPGGMLARVNRILVESAVLYTTSMLVDFIATLARSVSLLGLTDISLELAGIVFDLIIIRISQGAATEQTQAFTDSLAQRVVDMYVVESQSAADDRTRGSTHLDSTTRLAKDIPEGLTYMQDSQV